MWVSRMVCANDDGVGFAALEALLDIEAREWSASDVKAKSISVNALREGVERTLSARDRLLTESDDLCRDSRVPEHSAGT